jgi:hypothetical protein
MGMCLQTAFQWMDGTKWVDIATPKYEWWMKNCSEVSCNLLDISFEIPDDFLVDGKKTIDTHNNVWPLHGDIGACIRVSDYVNKHKNDDHDEKSKEFIDFCVSLLEDNGTSVRMIYTYS